MFPTCISIIAGEVPAPAGLLSMNPGAPRVHPEVGGNYPGQTNKIEAYGAEIFLAHGGAREGGIPTIF